jgi:hypothetical protein
MFRYQILLIIVDAMFFIVVLSLYSRIRLSHSADIHDQTWSGESQEILKVDLVRVSFIRRP